MIALARQFAAAGDMATAAELALRVIGDDRATGETRVIAGHLLGDHVPSWHFLLIRDHIRNQAYEDALIRAITPGCLVLEIGTGTGILAMMAARAGAEVVTCESNPAVAFTAREIIAANGLSDRVKVVNKHSTALELDADLGRPADILVSEIVSNDLLGEGVLLAHADACSRLLKRGGTVIPGAGKVRVALAFDPACARRAMGTVSGFDLSRFNQLARPYYEIATDSRNLALRSVPVDLFSFAFDGSHPPGDRRASVEIESTGGTVNGVIQWLALDLDACGQYENQPASGVGSCWAALFWPFPTAIETEPGQTVSVGGHHTSERVRIWRNAL